jgi:hypothetical protein
VGHPVTSRTPCPPSPARSPPTPSPPTRTQGAAATDPAGVEGRGRGIFPVRSHVRSECQGLLFWGGLRSVVHGPLVLVGGGGTGGRGTVVGDVTIVPGVRPRRHVIITCANDLDVSTSTKPRNFTRPDLRTGGFPRYQNDTFRCRGVSHGSPQTPFLCTFGYSKMTIFAI